MDSLLYGGRVRSRTVFAPLISLWDFIQAGDVGAVVAVGFSAVFTPLVVGAFTNYVLPRTDRRSERRQL